MKNASMLDLANVLQHAFLSGFVAARKIPEIKRPTKDKADD